jgi:hypothetical protein
MKCQISSRLCNFKTRKQVDQAIKPFGRKDIPGFVRGTVAIAKTAHPAIEPGLFTMRGRRTGESLFHRSIVSSLWFRQVTHDVKLTNFQNLLPRSQNSSKGHTRRLSS